MERRPHLTKEQRLPKCYKEVEKIIRSVKSCKSNFKTLLANSRLRGNVFKKVYSLTVNTLKNYSYIQAVIDYVQLLEKEKYLRREIASVLIYELLFGTGTLPGESKVVTTILTYENDIRHAHELLQNKHLNSFRETQINIPRYVRVHTLVTTVAYVIRDLENYGYKQIFYDDSLTEEKYFDMICNLEKGSFLIDFHFKDVLVFEHSENLTELDLYKNGHIFLQDKSSYIPVHVLNPEPGCSVLDACAAPGMKTVHIASKMINKGILIACERDKLRFETLKNILDAGAVKICKSLCKDFRLIDPADPAYSDLEYILLDPSCSGSGMVNRMDEITDTEDSKNKERLSKLAGFQIILLKHALKFPSVKRVVYSTCSIHEEENEYVVHEALSSFSSSFKLVSAMPDWSQRGFENYEFGHLCLRTVPEKHKTNGFFVAMLERIGSDTKIGNNFLTNCEEGVKDELDTSEKSNKRNFTETFMEEKSESFEDIQKKRKKHKKQKENDAYESHAKFNEGNNKSFINEELDDFDSSAVKRKKHKKREKDDVDEFLHETNEETDARENKSKIVLDINDSESVPIKKKKHKKRKDDAIEFLHESNEESEFRENKSNIVVNIDDSESVLIKKKKHKKRKDVIEFLHESNEESEVRENKSNIHDSESVPIKKKKHKKRRKDDAIEFLYESNEKLDVREHKSNTVVNIENSESVPIKKKKHKKKKESPKDSLEDSNEKADENTVKSNNVEKLNYFDCTIAVNKDIGKYSKNTNNFILINNTTEGQDYFNSMSDKSKKCKKKRENLSDLLDSNEKYAENINENIEKENTSEVVLVSDEDLCENKSELHNFDNPPMKRKKHKRKEKVHDHVSDSDVKFHERTDISIGNEEQQKFYSASVKHKKHKEKRRLLKDS